MTSRELARRQRRAETEQFVIAETAGGYRVHSPALRE